MSTFSVLAIDQSAFDDIQRQLRAAGYADTANYKLGGTPTIVMEGLAVQPRATPEAATALPSPSEVFTDIDLMKVAATWREHDNGQWLGNTDRRVYGACMAVLTEYGRRVSGSGK